MQLYAITDRSLLPAGPGTLAERLRAQVRAWAAGGVDWIQFREKDLPPGELAALARELADEMRVARCDHPARPTPAQPARLVLNGMPVSLALKCGADGVHLTGGATAGQILEARAAGAWVTVSCHTLDDVAASRAGSADAVLWAPVFEKTVQGRQVRSGSGLDALARACAAASPVPVFALGGVTRANASDCREQGAAGVAGIRLFLDTGAGSDWRALRSGPLRAVEKA